MPGCVVTGCTTGNYGKVEFQTFPFPKSQKLKEKWINQVNRDNWKPNQNSRVCAKHFDEEAYYETPVGSQGRKLKKRKDDQNCFYLSLNFIILGIIVSYVLGGGGGKQF